MKKPVQVGLIAFGAVALSVGVVFLAGAQPSGAGKGSGKDKAESTKADAAMDAWVRLLAEHMTDRHDTIRHSARDALVVVGRPALPALRKLADGEDGASAEAAKKVIRRIEARGGHGRGFARFGPGIHRPGAGFGFNRGYRGAFGWGFRGRGPAMHWGQGAVGRGAFSGPGPGGGAGFRGPGAGGQRGGGSGMDGFGRGGTSGGAFGSQSGPRGSRDARPGRRPFGAGGQGGFGGPRGADSPQGE